MLEREAKRLELEPSRVGNLVSYSLVAGIVGARLGYALKFPTLYVSKPLSLLALTPTTLLPFMGILVGVIAFWILIDYQKLPLRPTLDSLAPGLALIMIFIGLAHILSGDAFGTPTNAPWAIRLWNEYRHPAQFYETLLALMVFTVVLGRFPKPAGTGLNFLLVVVLSAASRIFLEAFRGDSVFLPGGFREAQLAALGVMGVGFYLVRKWTNLETLEE